MCFAPSTGLHTSVSVKRFVVPKGMCREGDNCNSLQVARTSKRRNEKFGCPTGGRHKQLMALSQILTQTVKYFLVHALLAEDSCVGPEVFSIIRFVP
jgi:hypothetical protein